MNQIIGYICRNTGAHNADVMCSSCVPYRSIEEQERLTGK